MLTLKDGRTELWQWDTGRELKVEGECSQVHFSNKIQGRSIDVDVIDSVAKIPDVLLQTDGKLNVWAFVGTAENGYTKISKAFVVNKRNRPADYVFTPTDQTSIKELNDRLEKLEANQDPEAVSNAVKEYLENNPIKEEDPTVPSWAKQPNKPTYNASEVGALPNTTKIPTRVSELANDSGFLTQHQDLSNYAKKTEVPAKTSQLTNDSGFLTFIPSEYVTEAELDRKGYLTEHQDLSAYAKKSELPSVPTKTSQLTNDSGFLTSIPIEYVTETELNAKGYLKSVPSEYVTETELNAKGYLTQHQDLTDYAKKSEIPTKAEDISAEPSGTAETKVSEHNTSTAAHNDIRLLIEGLTTRLNTLANSDDTTLDQMAEVVAYIKSNRTLIESVTTDKVNVLDIVNNLTTNVSNKPLSAAQGVVLKGLIDTLQTAVNNIKVPTKTSELTNDSGFLTQHQSLADYAKKTEVPTKTSQLTNDSGFLTQHQDLSAYAKISQIPTKVSQLTNDKNYLTSIPSEYITETELTSKGYLTSIPSEYITETELTAKKYLTSVPSEYVTETELTNKGYAVKSSAETWTFTLEDGSTVTKKVVLV